MKCFLSLRKRIQTKKGQRQDFKMLMCIKIALFPIINQNLHAETNDSLASPLHWWFTCGVCDIKQQNIRFSPMLAQQTGADYYSKHFITFSWNSFTPLKRHVGLFHLFKFDSKSNQSLLSLRSRSADTLTGNKFQYLLDYIVLFPGRWRPRTSVEMFQ